MLREGHAPDDPAVHRHARPPEGLQVRQQVQRGLLASWSGRLAS